jgi:pyruvate formate lyase activating enzyme
MLNVFNIQRFSIHDGEGVRTNIFFKGCQLHCVWCNNPESIDPFPSIMFDERKCHRFGDCISAGKGQITINKGILVIDRENILDAGALRNVCPSKALEIIGREMSTDELTSEIERDQAFFRMSDGGVTFSGGEPLSQSPELHDLASGLRKRSIHVSVETSLHIPWETLETYLDVIDVFLADLKHTDPLKFLEFTGGDLSLVLNNYKKLDQAGKKYIVRVPVIPGFNHTQPEIFGIIDFAAELINSSEIDFIPFHSLAREKYHMLGKEYVFGDQANVGKDEILPYAEYAESKGLIAKILD